jgi:hypothetical protein
MTEETKKELSKLFEGQIAETYFTNQKDEEK